MKLKWFNWILFFVYSFFLYLMIEISIQYIPINTDVAFLRIKQNEIKHDYYRIAFFTHAYSSIFCLLAAYTQFSANIRNNFPKFHKIGGYIYMISVLFLAGPSGLILGYHANGGLSSKISFLLLGLLWIAFTGYSIFAILRKDIQNHKNFMIRSYSLALSAITLRAWKWILVFLFHPRPMDVYKVVAWLGWVLNIIIAEYIIYRIKEKKS